MRRVLASVAVIGLVAAALGGIARGSQDAGPGCLPLQAAVAHYSGGVAASTTAAAPIPCGMPTGSASGESAIAITNQNSVFYAPAVPAEAGVELQVFAGPDAGFAKTTDLGKTWTFVEPVAENLGVSHIPGGGWAQIDHKFYMDRQTGRLFWANPQFGPELIFWTDDDGAHWSASALPLGYAAEWTQITTAKPRISTTTGYPTVVYACGEYDSVGRHGDVCQKSLDGGLTWILAGQGFFGVPFSSHPECAGQTEHPNFSPWAPADSQGRIYELLLCGTSTFLMRSDDEGATWPVVATFPDQIINHAELRSDSADNLYIAYDEPGGLFMRTSKNLGATWGPKMDVFAPGVVGLRKHFGFDVGEPGHVAFSYLGHTNERVGFDGYITETANALDAQPLFWSGAVDSLFGRPLDFGGAGGSNGLGLDYVSVAIGPDGTAWASFWDACGLDLPQAQVDPGCPSDRNPADVTTYGFRGFAGRLAHQG